MNSAGYQDVLAEFTATASMADPDLRLDRCAALLARSEYRDLDVDRLIGDLDDIADAFTLTAGDRADQPLALAEWLFTIQGFRGNGRSYYDPSNSYVNRVLERRFGIPISLTWLYMEIGRRLGMTIEGVGLPGHFIARASLNGGETVLVDPFHGGIAMTREDCEERVTQVYGIRTTLDDYYFAAVTKRQLLTRMAANLKGIYLHRRDYLRAERTISFILGINPWSLDEIRDRGLVRELLGDTDGARADLTAYLDHQQDAEDAETIAARLRHLD